MKSRCQIVTDAVIEVLATIHEPEGRPIPRLGPAAARQLRQAIHRALASTGKHYARGVEYAVQPTIAEER